MTAGSTFVSEMNDASIVAMAGCSGSDSQLADVGALHDDDALVVAQPHVELAVAHVDGVDARGAALQQAVGEAAGRRADIERDQPARHRCRRPRAHGRAFAAPADKARRLRDIDCGLVGDERAGAHLGHA